MDIDKEKNQARFSEINEAINSAKGLVKLSDEEFWSRKKILRRLNITYFRP